MEGRKHRDKSVDDLGSNGSEMEMEKSRESQKSRSKDREKSKEREKDESSRKYPDKHGRRESNKERRSDKDRGHDRDKHRDSEKSRDKSRDKDMDREVDVERYRKDERGTKNRDGHDKSRDLEKDHAKQEREKSKDRERDRGEGREQRGKDRDRDRDREKDKIKDRERDEKGMNREKDKLERVKDKEKTKDDKSRSKDRVRDIGRGKREEELEVNGRDTQFVENKAKDAEANSQNHERFNDHGEKQVGSQSNSELAVRLMRIKEEKMKRKADDTSEILSWVSKSRKLEEKKNIDREKAARISKLLDEQDNFEDESDEETMAGGGEKDLAGIKILHGLNKVIEGGAVVLTLKDQSILADGDINEEVDMLENVEIGEQKRRDDAYKAAKKTTDPFNDDFDSRKSILPQYDDPVDDEGVTLDDSGRFTGEAEKKLEELRRRIEGSTTSRAYEDLSSNMKNTSDYYTPDEMLQFKKPKKKKSLRKREKLDLDALEAEAISSGLGAGDLGSRNDLKGLSAKELQAKRDTEMRNSAYQTALAKAEEASKVLRQTQTQTVNSMEDDDMVFGEDYEDLAKSLDQARKLVLSGHVKPGQTSDARSGFATLEKDHVGSLTPMLGDKKVEHFLGIKRKPDSGSMVPPPPKKPNTAFGEELREK